MFTLIIAFSESKQNALKHVFKQNVVSINIMNTHPRWFPGPVSLKQSGVKNM